MGHVNGGGARVHALPPPSDYGYVSIYCSNYIYKVTSILKRRGFRQKSAKNRTKNNSTGSIIKNEEIKNYKGMLQRYDGSKYSHLLVTISPLPLRFRLQRQYQV